MTLSNKIAFVLICTVIIFTTAAYGAVHQPILAIFYVAVAGLVILWALDGFKTGALTLSRSWLQVPLFAAAAYAAIQVIPFGTLAEVAGVSGIPRTISVDPFATQLTGLHYLALGLFFSASLVFVDSAARIRRLVVVISIFGFIYAFFAILQSVLSPGKIYGIYETRSAVPFGSFVNRHNFAAFMEMTLGVPLGLLFIGAVARDKRLLYITGIALMGVALLMSGSRGGLVAFLAQIVFLLLLTTRTVSQRALILKTAAAGFLILAIVAGSVFIGGESSLTRIVDTASSEDISTNRGNIWKVTSMVIAGNLPFGAGLGAFGAAYTPYDMNSGLERVEQAHNDYLQVLADAGIVGALIGLFFLFFLFRAGLDAARSENRYKRGVAIGAMSGTFAILVHSIFDFVLHTTAISLMFITLLTLIESCRKEHDDDLEFADAGGGRKFASGDFVSLEEERRRRLQ